MARGTILGTVDEERTLAMNSNRIDIDGGNV